MKFITTLFLLTCSISFAQQTKSGSSEATKQVGFTTQAPTKTDYLTKINKLVKQYYLQGEMRFRIVDDVVMEIRDISYSKKDTSITRFNLKTAIVSVDEKHFNHTQINIECIDGIACIFTSDGKGNYTAYVGQELNCSKEDEELLNSDFLELRKIILKIK